MRLTWMTDIHLVFLRDKETGAFDLEYFEFLDQVRREEPDAILISGDIGEAPELSAFLEQLADAWQRPIYFVLGNHDYYFSSVAKVREEVGLLCDRVEHLHFLSRMEVVSLAPDLGLIGHDGWADGRCGLYHWSDVKLSDIKYIDDLIFEGPDAADRRLPVLHALGDEAGEHIARVLPKALTRHRHILLLTHLPPFEAASRYRGQPADYQWAPFTVCKAVGDAILKIMPGYPDRELTILCGHTHDRFRYDPLPNIHVHVGAATYGEPIVERTFVL